MIPVDSTNLESVGYENNTLYVLFHSGGLYSYDGVPYSLYQSLMSAPSKGKFLSQYIKNSYPYKKLNR